jgi:hypothetical protein
MMITQLVETITDEQMQMFVELLLKSGERDLGRVIEFGGYDDQVRQVIERVSGKLSKGIT